MMRIALGRSARSSDMHTGCQKRRRYSPMTVPGPTWVNSGSSRGTSRMK